MKTTSMENISTGVLGKNKEHFLRSKCKAENHMMYWDIYNCISQNEKNDDLKSIVSNLLLM